MTTASAIRSCRYQRWSGQLNQDRWTWLTIVTTGIRLAIRNSRTRGLVMSSGMLVLGACGMFYVLAMLETLLGTPQAQGICDFVHVMLGVDVSSMTQLADLREPLWRSVFVLMIQIELFWVLFIVARVGPELIANDLKARALPIYFAKPVTPLTYLAGKWMVVAAFVAMVSLVPNLASLLFGALMTGGPGTWGQFFALAWDLLLAGLGLCVVTGAIIIALSSLTSDRRYVTVAWLAVCVLLVVAQTVVNKALPEESAQGLLGCISLRDNVLVLTNWLFGIHEAWEAANLPAEAFSRAPLSTDRVLYAAVVMTAWVVGAFLLCYRQVVRFSRSAANV